MNASLRRGYRAPRPSSCVDCLAWGRLSGRRCTACSVFRHNNRGEGRCAGCGRVLAVQNGYCRLCWHQAGIEGKAAGRRRGADAAYLGGVLDLPAIRYHQLFFDRMKVRRPHSPARTHDRPGRPRASDPDPVGPPCVGWIQPTLFKVSKDFTLFNEHSNADPANPWVRWGHYLAHRRGEVRGWTRGTRYGVRRALIILLSQHTAGQTIAYSQVFALTRPLDIAAERVAEILTDMSILIDDRRSSFEDWLDRKLDGIAAGIRRDVETWQRTLHDGGPRTKARDQATVWNYLNSTRQALLNWSSCYTHLREVTADDIVAILDTVHGARRENLLVALRSLFSHSKKNGTIFRSPTSRIKAGQKEYGVLQPLQPDEVDRAIGAATTPASRLILALAAVHAARSKTIRELLLDDVDLGNRRIVIGGRIRPLDDLTHHVLLDWLHHRRTRWPNTANPHLLINQQTAMETGPASSHWAATALRGQTATLERLRMDRQLEEALAHGGDPLHLAAVFGLDEKTAIRYGNTARQLLESAAEQHDPTVHHEPTGRIPPGSPKTPEFPPKNPQFN